FKMSHNFDFSAEVHEGDGDEAAQADDASVAEAADEGNRSTGSTLCECCEQSPKVAKQRFGKECKKALDNVTKRESRNFKASPKDEKVAKDHKYFQEVKKKGGGPLHRIIMNYRAQSDESKGSGHSRNSHFDLSKELEELRVSQSTINGVQLLYMTHERWMTVAAEKHSKTAREAQDDWDKALKAVPKHKRRGSGRQLKLPMPDEEYVKGEHAATHSRMHVFASKDKKIKDPDLKEIGDSLATSGFELGDDFFKNSGALVQSQSSLADMNIVSPSKAQGSSSALLQQSLVSEEKKQKGDEKTSKKTKRYDLLAAKNRCRVKINDDFKKVREQLTALTKQAEELLQEHAASKDYECYVDTLRQRLNLVKSATAIYLEKDVESVEAATAAVKDVLGEEPPDATFSVGVTCCLKFANLIDKVDVTLKDDDAKGQDTQLKESISHLAKAFNKSDLQPVLKSWLEGASSSEPLSMVQTEVATMQAAFRNFMLQHLANYVLSLAKSRLAVMPLDDISKVQPLAASMKSLLSELENATDEDAIKRWIEAAKNANDVMKQLIGCLSRAGGDLSRAEKSRKRKIETDQIAEAKKAAKKKEQAKKQLEESLKKVQKDEKNLIFFQALPVFSDIPIIDESNFVAEISKAGEGPYMVRVPSLATIIEGNSQNILSVFAAQFPMAPAAREKGRVQSPLKVTGGQLQKIQEGFCSFLRKAGVNMWPEPESEHKEASDLRMVHLYGFLGNMVYAEYNSLATLRYTHRGEREVILMNFSEFWSVLTPEQQQHELTGAYNVTHYVQDLLRHASSEDFFMKEIIRLASEQGGGQKKFLHKVHVGPKCLLFVPAGMLVIERCMNGGINVGMRMSLQDHSDMAMQNLKGGMKQATTGVVDRGVFGADPAEMLRYCGRGRNVVSHFSPSRLIIPARAKDSRVETLSIIIGLAQVACSWAAGGLQRVQLFGGFVAMTAGSPAGLRRMKRHISDQDCGPNLDVPYGPNSLRGLFSWAAEGYERLRTQFADAKAIMEQKLRRGIKVSSHYSGKGTGESCASQIERAIRDDVMAQGSAIALDLRSLPQQQFQHVFSVDCSEAARKALLATGCKHVFGKIEDRMRPDLQRQLRMMEPADTVSCADKEQQHNDIKQLLFEAHPPSHSADQTAWCYRHEKCCPIWDGMFDDDRMDFEVDEPHPEPYRINVSGFSCTDFSKRRATTLPRFAGKTAPTFWKWLREIQLSRPHYVFWECSTFFPEEVIANEMESEYMQIIIITSPTLMGWPVTRLRKFGCLIRRDILFLGSDKEFHDVFQRQCSVNGDIFFTAAPDEYIVDQMISENLFLPELPASLLADVNFSDTECQFLAGNCFAMNVMGSWMMYVLARTIPLPMASASSGFMLRGDNGQRTQSFEDLVDSHGDSGDSDDDSCSGVSGV
ncbi:unnamed protein product, partial [Symbiodinium sp. CCMP2456]